MKHLTWSLVVFLSVLFFEQYFYESGSKFVKNLSDFTLKNTGSSTSTTWKPNSPNTEDLFNRDYVEEIENQEVKFLSRLDFLAVSILLSQSPVLSNCHAHSTFYRKNYCPPLGIFFSYFSRGSNRHLSALRFILLIVAGDIESNPGPVTRRNAQSQSLNDSEVKEISICPKCTKEVVDTNCLGCEICDEWFHYPCTGATQIMCKDVGEHRQFVFICDACRSNILPDMQLMKDGLKKRKISVSLLFKGYDQNHNVAPPNKPTVVPPKQQDFIVVKGIDDPLSNFYPFKFVVDSITFKSAEHAYQYLKAKLAKMDETASKILRSFTPLQAKRIAHSFLPQNMPENELVDLMKKILAEKEKQCYSFRKKLRDSDKKEIFHSTYRGIGPFWCTGLDYRNFRDHNARKYSGANAFGILLEDTRKNLKPEKDYERQMEVKFINGCVYVFYDGEDSTVPSTVNHKFREDFRQGGMVYQQWAPLFRPNRPPLLPF